MISMRKKPFLKVIERIADLANLRFEVDDDVLRVVLDEPYHETYQLNLLNLQRNSSGIVNTSTNVLAGDGEAGTVQATAWKPTRPAILGQRLKPRSRTCC